MSGLRELQSLYLRSTRRYYAHKHQLAATANSLLLRKSLQRRIWYDSARQSGQVSKVGRQASERLGAAGLRDLAALHDADPRRIEALAQRNYPFGVSSFRQLPLRPLILSSYKHWSTSYSVPFQNASER